MSSEPFWWFHHTDFSVTLSLMCSSTSIVSPFVWAAAIMTASWVRDHICLRAFQRLTFPDVWVPLIYFSVNTACRWLFHVNIGGMKRLQRCSGSPAHPPCRPSLHSSAVCHGNPLYGCQLSSGDIRVDAVKPEIHDWLLRDYRIM